MKVFATISLFFCLLSVALAPAFARRGNPVGVITASTYKSQFYIIDSDDDNTDARQPAYKFVDTLFDPTHWHRVTGFKDLTSAPNTDDGYAETVASDSILFQYANASLRLPPQHICTNGLVKLAVNGQFQSPIITPVNRSMPAGFIDTFQAIICPLWGDMEFRTAGDSTKVFYRMTTDSCYVSYYNLALKGTNGKVRATYQITFAKADSSVTFNYRSFDGAYNGTPAAQVFQNETTIGVQNHQTIYATMYLDRGTYYAKSNGSQQYAQPLHNSLAVKFIRVIPNIIHIKSIDFPPSDRYEMTSNTLIPKVTIGNFTDQDHMVVVNVKITDLSNNNQFYNHTDSLSVGFDDDVQFSSAIYQGLRCGAYRMTATATIPSVGTDGWTTDNIMTRDFTLMNIAAPPYYDNFVILDACNWHVYGAKWVPADSVMFDPPSPRSTGAALMNTKDVNGNDYLIPGGSDTLISCPINLQGLSNVWLSFSYQRGLKTDSMKAGIKSRVLIGPEPLDRNSTDIGVFQGDSLVIEALASTGTEWSPADSNWKTIGKLYGGLDVSTQKFRVHVASQFLHDHSRFRIRLAARDNHTLYTFPIEDNDNWVIDEFQIAAPAAGKTDLEISNFDLGAGPFTHIPRSVKIITPKVTIASNGSSTNSAVYNVHLLIKDVLNRAVYDKSQSLVTPGADTDIVLYMPAWDISGTQGATSPDQLFTAKINISQNFNEYNRTNDTNTFFRTLFIDNKYALDDGVPDTVGTMTAADNNWFYYDFVPLANDSLRGIEIYNLGPSGNTNWTINIRDTGNTLLGTRAFSYNATSTTGGFLPSSVIPFGMTGGATYRIQCIETQGSGVGGDASRGLMWETRHSTTDPQYAALYPAIVSSFHTSSYADYLTAQRNASAGGPLLPMIRLIFQGSSTYLPIELASFTANRTDDGSVNLGFRTAKEESVSHFEVDRESSSGWINAGNVDAKNERLGADYSLLDQTAPVTNLTYRLTEVDLDGSRKVVGQVAVGPFGAEAFSAKVYPNPSSQNIHVMLTGGSEDISLTLYDALGKVVLTREHVSGNIVDLDASSLSAGSYWLEARSGETYSRTKISVTK